MATGTLAAATLVNSRTPVDMGSGASPTATDGDYMTNTGREWLAAHNPEASDLVISVTIPATVDGQVVSAKTVTVTTLTTMLVGPFPANIYSDGSSRVKLTCTLSGAGTLANCKLKAIKFA